MSYQSQPLRFVSFRLVHLQIDKWPCPGSWARNKEPNPRKPPCSLSLGWKRFWRKVVRTKWYCSGSPGEVEEVKVGKIVIESCNRARWFEWDHGGINVGEMKKKYIISCCIASFFYYSVHLYKLCVDFIPGCYLAICGLHIGPPVQGNLTSAVHLLPTSHHHQQVLLHNLFLAASGKR